MKKLLFIITLLFVGIASQAQIKFGVKAGANFYKFNGDDADFGDASSVSPEFKAGFAGGGLINIPINKMFSVQPEVLYSMEGARYEEEGEKVLFKTDYLNVPVLFQYNDASGFYVETGPQVGFLLSAKITDGETTDDVKDAFKEVNFSWAIGLGYKLKNGLGFGARYNLGFANIIDEDDVDIKLGGFHVGIFYLFRGVKK